MDFVLRLAEDDAEHALLLAELLQRVAIATQDSLFGGKAILRDRRSWRDCGSA